MRFRRTTLSSSICVGAMLWVAAFARGEWQNSLKPTGPAGEALVLVKDGKAVRPIKLATGATAIEKSGAAELQHWIEKITTARPEITTVDSGSCIRLQTDPALGEEGYRISVDGGNLALAGGTGRGVMNAVFAFLEEDLGCRFYTPDMTKLPEERTLAVRPVVRSFTPKLRLRDPFYVCAFNAAWSVENRTNAPHAMVREEQGGHVDYDGLFVHTHGKLLPPDKYFHDHPEYFALDAKGARYPHQLCATEAAVARIVTEAVLRRLRKNPETEIVSISKNDNPGTEICYCERCKKIRAEEGSDMGCQLVLVNAVADAVAKEFPHVTIDTLAYLETLPPPKHARPRPNVAIRLCNDVVGAWSFPFTPAEKCPVAKTIVDWSNIHPRIYIWDYNANYSHYLLPMPNVDVMAANIRFWIDHHAEGVMLEGGNSGPSEADEMKSWVTSKLLWDPSRDEKALVQDFIWGYYGAAAPALAQYEALLEGLRQTHMAEMANAQSGIRYPPNAPFFTKEFANQATAIFEQAKKLAGSDESLVRRVERAELPILYLKCWRGPKFAGKTYELDVADFERIARHEGISVLTEGSANLEPVLKGWKERVEKASRR
jgi:hypothetical protein